VDPSEGSGWYPSTAAVGTSGNTAIAGHRTGYGSPFADLDQVEVGDVITMTTRQGVRLRYAIVQKQLVDPDATWVLGPDPLHSGTSTLTLTTCDPPHVNSKRLIVFATLLT
jgi:sortase A